MRRAMIITYLLVILLLCVVTIVTIKSITIEKNLMEVRAKLLVIENHIKDIHRIIKEGKDGGVKWREE